MACLQVRGAELVPTPRAEPLLKPTAGRHAYLLQQKRAASLVLVGALSVLIGTGMTAKTGWMKYVGYQENYLGQPFPSGNNFLPNTVSLLVSRPDSPEGKAFFAFGLLGCICLLVSWYPWELKNVYSGDDQRLLWWFGPSWGALRHFLPPCGVMLVACLQVLPTPQRTEADNVLLVWHNIGAQLSIGGYVGTELQYLLFGAKHAGANLTKLEWHLRFWLSVIAAACCVTFLVTDNWTAKFAAMGCDDTWRVPTAADIALLRGNDTLADLLAQAAHAQRVGMKLLYDTASGKCLQIKHAEVWSETLAGGLMAFHMLIIWFFCPERHIGFAERLPDVHDEEQAVAPAADARGAYAAAPLKEAP